MLSSNPTSIEAINAVFGTRPEQTKSVNLIKQYKGITLDQDVHVVEVKSDSATIKASRREIFPCLVGEIHLHSQAFPQPISGRIQPLDYAQGTFLLSDLAYMEWHHRSQERVQPQETIYVNMSQKRDSYRVFLEDISVDGIGVLGNNIMNSYTKLKVGSKVCLDFQLGEEFHYANLSGMLVYRQKVGLQLVKLGLHLFPDGFQRRTLQRYIYKRRDDILEEVNKTYIRSREPQRVENLFF